MVAPGPDAEQAFRLGIIAGAIVGIAAIAVIYMLGNTSVWFIGYVVVILFPVYLVVVAAILSVWLGYDVDPGQLEPVSKSR
ncbi:MAG: hypothetical protein J07HQW1_01230 [Haloquadratum walsbyi J07HQW1]|jgi:hypothetical protein|uniref:Uncharacterized protein n=1 Tax=Haloquadratum walsbyi J07HQW1 TaxID=1238424 RepID=U1N477_9EURY|nr:MAG: hypothetical protein J07HQW1_01230 [Haloquadratum walsbyi J07HQW1]